MSSPVDRAKSFVYGLIMFLFFVLSAVFFSFDWGKIPAVVSFIIAIGFGFAAWLNE